MTRKWICTRMVLTFVASVVSIHLGIPVALLEIAACQK